MQRWMRLLWTLTLPGTFLFSGAGLLWLYKFRSEEGTFYERLVNYTADWIGAHILLFISVLLLIPASLLLWSLVRGKKGATLADIALILVMIAAFFLGGQYSIDFLMPSIAEIGGDAHAVHRGLFSNPLTNIMFYELAELNAIGLLLLTIALAWSGILSRPHMIILLALWLLVIAGNILDFALAARLSLLALGLAYIPIAGKRAAS